MTDLTEATLVAAARKMPQGAARLFIKPTEFAVDLTDITDEQAVALVTEAINGLFAAHRVVTPAERSAYLRGPEQDYVFDALLNGHWKDPLGETVIVDDLGEAVAMSVHAVAEKYPAHASQQIVWRIEPELTRQPARRAKKAWGVSARQAHFALYMRLVATPVGV